MIGGIYSNEKSQFHACGGMRYVSVIWFVFHVLQLLPIRFNTTELVVYQKLYNETFAKTGLKWDFPLI